MTQTNKISDNFPVSIRDFVNFQSQGNISKAQCAECLEQF